MVARLAHEHLWLETYLRLNKRVRVYVSSSCETIANRIEASAGTRLVNRQEVGVIGYEENAHLPCEPWRPLTTQEQAALLAKHPPRDAGRTVSIVKLPGPFSGALWKNFQPVDTTNVPDAIIQPLSAICKLGEPLDWIGPVENSPGLKTVTVNNEDERYIGLHLDSWDDLPLEDRARSTNRICLNIGQSDRYFLFLPFSLIEMSGLLSEFADWDSNTPHIMLGDHFMERFPHVPAIRCRLQPGEAYIAPTENLLHDGSSEGQRYIDEQFTVRGHIRPLSTI